LAGAGGGQAAERPGLSLDLAQRYVHHLARHDGVDGNLIRVLAAYNAGPGNLLKWLPRTATATTLPVHRGHPARRNAQLRAAGARLLLDLRLTPRPAVAEPGPDRAGEFPRFAGPEEVTAMLRRGRGRLH
jgi:hypothetical protein